MNQNQRKHELETNELAQSLNSQIEKFKPYMTQTILIVVAVVLGVVAIRFWNYSRSSATEGQWEDYLYSAQTLEFRGLTDVARTYPETPAGQFAKLRVADNDLMRGLSSLVENRDEFFDRAKRAIESYEELAADSRASVFIRRRATYGAAHGHETVGNFDKAREGYQQLVENAPDDPITVLAKQGLERLADESVVAIYEKFRAWQPSDTAPGADELLPKRPNIDFPDATELNPVQPPAASEAQNPPASSEPASGDAPATEPAPSDSAAPAKEEPAAPPAEDGSSGG